MVNGLSDGASLKTRVPVLFQAMNLFHMIVVLFDMRCDEYTVVKDIILRPMCVIYG